LEYELQSVGSTLVPLEKNVIDLAWDSERPAPPHDAVIVQPVEYAGMLLGCIGTMRCLENDLTVISHGIIRRC
jgi:hypothetical protein